MSFEHLDTSKFDSFINERENIISTYKNDVIESYKSIIKDLKENWEGNGAHSFFKDSDKVYSNILAIEDRLNTMCDTLSDCLTVFQECDTSLAKINKESSGNQAQ